MPVRHAQHALAVADLNLFVHDFLNDRAQARRPPRPPFRIARLIWLKAGSRRWPAVTDAIGLVVGSFAIPGVTDFLVFAGHGYVLRVRVLGGHSSRGLSVISSKVRPVSECIASRPWAISLSPFRRVAGSPQTMVAISVSSSTTRRQPAKHSRPLVLPY